ncbi:putative aminopeptidase n [Besnoitia besnoiti]|uniref:Putative aminopeptidase n n=1 Tax=Besnoitia besnoiti TaxID=94643 RepID=A0A2A9MBT6_BESBE|nr:putative aminopeptidase n [Besnoitia besnoiti]PFH35329.1 putative aminopeptidase n [Besnoitia besnoiti]
METAALLRSPQGGVPGCSRAVPHRLCGSLLLGVLLAFLSCVSIDKGLLRSEKGCAAGLVRGVFASSGPEETPGDEKQPTGLKRLDYTPPDFFVEHAYVEVDLNDDDTTVTSLLTLHRRAGAELRDLVLDGDSNLVVGSVALGATVPTDAASEGVSEGDARVQYSRTEDNGLVIPAGLLPETASERFVLKTVVSVNPKANLALSGLYKSGDIFVTQNEPAGFRRITFFLDRPDVLATYRVRILAARSLPVLLSNGDKVLEGSAPGNRHFAEFVDRFPKPSYLFAIVAGELASISEDFVTQSGRLVKVSIYATPEKKRNLGWALRALLKAMRWDEERFGREYEYSEFRVVCVDSFNAGAMENTSLNIFVCKLLLADEATSTDADHKHVLNVIAHEYFHNWTGNRVTCRDWFQLTLKEGLTVFRDQQFTAEATSRPVQRIEDVQTILSAQFGEDSGPLAHPIRPDSYQSVDNLYTTTVYEKGAEVVRMYQTILGEQGFRRGMDLYFQRHDGQAVTCDDFRAAMADANGRDFSQFGRWYSQAGTPEVTVVSSSYDADDRELVITLSQRTPPTPGQLTKRPLHIPVAVGCIGKQSKLDVLTPDATQVLELTEELQTFILADVEEDCVLSVLRDFSAPVKLVFPSQTRDDLTFLMAHDSDAVNKWRAAQALSLDVLRARIAQFETRVANGAAQRDWAIRNDFFDTLPDSYVSAMKTIVTAPELEMGHDIKALTLDLPDAGELELEVEVINPEAIDAARVSVRRDIGRVLKAELRRLYRALTLPPGTPESAADTSDWGRRRLRNVVLAFLAGERDGAAAQLALRHFDAASVMTDKVAALRVLTHIPGEEKERAFAQFHRDAAGNKLLHDKWLALQALSSATDTPARVAYLAHHADFDRFRPSAVYALFRVFSSASCAFHQTDGAGYAVLAEFIEEIDPHNPTVAANLAEAFSNWRRYEATRRDAMRATLESLRAIPNISPALEEVVEKALAPAPEDRE